ncbi:hypothetical protein L210DRAFT_3501071 [Boletus edulis BED1]|uniref:Uncharacterized protein n=1 Tax=Boletus edulis BED1 TaxID=1328754 RepID=A0AAD4GJA3_BOLED|nr:hypothetical protein L210DRAFT_3501071 [Boletus edulis BED1]
MDPINQRTHLVPKNGSTSAIHRASSFESGGRLVSLSIGLRTSPTSISKQGSGSPRITQKGTGPMQERTKGENFKGRVGNDERRRGQLRANFMSITRTSTSDFKNAPHQSDNTTRVLGLHILILLGVAAPEVSVRRIALQFDNDPDNLNPVPSKNR